MAYNSNRNPGSGRNRGRGGGRGRGQGMGVVGWCICPACGNKVAHNRGVNCYQIQCSSCGVRMARDMGTQGTPQRLNPRTSNTPQSGIQKFKNPIVDEEKCVGCSLCLTSCPIHAIHMINGKAHIQENMCHGCKVCIPSCPHGAIS